MNLRDVNLLLVCCACLILSCGPSRRQENHLEHVLEQMDAKVYYSLGPLSKHKGKVYPLEALYNISDTITYKQHQRLPSKFTIKNSGQLYMHIGEQTFIITRNDETGLANTIDMMDYSNHNKDVVIRFTYDLSGSLKEYVFQVSVAKQDWDYVSHKVIDEKKYFFNHPLLKDVNGTPTDKKRILELGNKLQQISSALNTFYQITCPEIPLTATLNKMAIQEELQQLIQGFVTQKYVDDYKNEVWRYFPNNLVRIDVSYQVSENGAFGVTLEINGIRIQKGLYSSPKLVNGVRDIFQKHTKFKIPTYACFPVSGTYKTTVMLDNGKVVAME